MTDALGIYTTYIALNATAPVGIPDEIRQTVEGALCIHNTIIMFMCTATQKAINDTMNLHVIPVCMNTLPYCCFLILGSSYSLFPPLGLRHA